MKHLILILALVCCGWSNNYPRFRIEDVSVKCKHLCCLDEIYQDKWTKERFYRCHPDCIDSCRVIEGVCG